MAVSDFLSVFFPEIIFRINSQKKVLYLTFDDGPTELTPWVLDELKKYKAKATFFCIGANIEKNTSLYHQIINQGHAIGNHTMHHLNGWKTKTKKYLNDVEECDSVLNAFKPQTTNHKPQTLFRPPYGKITPPQYFSLKKNHRIIMWDVLSKDYDKNISSEKCLNRVISKSKPGSVVVFHDSERAEKNLKHVLPRALEYFSERNFSFCALIN